MTTPNYSPKIIISEVEYEVVSMSISEILLQIYSSYLKRQWSSDIDVPTHGTIDINYLQSEFLQYKIHDNYIIISKFA